MFEASQFLMFAVLSLAKSRKALIHIYVTTRKATFFDRYNLVTTDFGSDVANLIELGLATSAAQIQRTLCL